MARKCRITGEPVLYVDCLECDQRRDCLRSTDKESRNQEKESCGNKS